MDEGHEKFSTDNDGRETFETWAACHGEGIRSSIVRGGANPILDELHDRSIAQMRSDLASFDKGPKDADEVENLTDRYGRDWTGIFEAGQLELDPDCQKRARFNNPSGHHYSPSTSNRSDSDSGSGSGSSRVSSGSSYHHVATASPPGDAKARNSGSMNPIKSVKNYRENQRATQRKHRGLMQWKPMRSIAFAKDEVKFTRRKLKAKTKLTGRESDVETEV